jgi:flagellin-like protein
MKLKQLLNDDDAVSPVIGVILMVAITVILAAVIATFVLGLGEQVSQTSPNTSFSFDYEEGNDGDDFGGTNSGDALLTITHSGGPNINADQLGATGSSQTASSSGSYDDFSSSGVGWNSGKMSAGDSISIRMKSDDRINIVWENDDGSESSILQTFRGPDS